MYQFLGNKTFDVSEDIKEHEHRGNCATPRC